MTRYTLRTTVSSAFAPTLERVRAVLADVGFGVITEIDLAATLKTKLDVDVPPHVILGACRPGLAHEALLADPSIAAVLPCNVVVRSVDEGACVVEAFDPAVMADLAGDALHAVAADARERLRTLLDTLDQED